MHYRLAALALALAAVLTTALFFIVRAPATAEVAAAPVVTPTAPPPPPAPAPVLAPTLPSLVLAGSIEPIDCAAPRDAAERDACALRLPPPTPKQIKK